MGQQDVLNILESDSSRWWSAKEVKEELRKRGESIGVVNRAHDNLFKLAVFHIIDCKGLGLWQHEKVFKIKRK